MRRNSIIFLLLASIFLFCSCSKEGDGMIFDDGDDTRIEQILETLKTKTKILENNVF